jgi:hypothetical protein
MATIILTAVVTLATLVAVTAGVAGWVLKLRGKV